MTNYIFLYRIFSKRTNDYMKPTVGKGSGPGGAYGYASEEAANLVHLYRRENRVVLIELAPIGDELLLETGLVFTLKTMRL